MSNYFTENISIRLSREEIENIKKSVKAIDRNARIYLFGSRTNKESRGGDIDILIVSEKIKRREIRKIRWNFFDVFGEQKMDIVVDDGRMLSPFVKMIFPGAVRL